MKRHIILFVVILVWVACTRQQQRRDQIVNFHNFSVPENLSFDLECQTLLTDGILNADIPDSSKMRRLDRAATIQLILINSKVHARNSFMNDSVPQSLYENIHYYIYGKLDLQPHVKSLVIWEFGHDILRIVGDSKHLWLLNIKDDKLCSVVWLDFRPEMLIDIPPFTSSTYLKGKRFTTLSKSNKIHYPFWVNLDLWLHSKKNNIDAYYAHYRVSEDGYIEFIND